MNASKETTLNEIFDVDRHTKDRLRNWSNKDLNTEVEFLKRNLNSKYNDGEALKNVRAEIASRTTPIDELNEFFF